MLTKEERIQGFLSQMLIYQKSETLQQMFDTMVERHWKTMAGHMLFLRDLARECSNCVEFGIRFCHSSVALLVGCPGTVDSWDIEKLVSWQKPVAKLAGDRWRRHYVSSLVADVPECDLLMHDSLHTKDHVAEELRLHGNKARKYLVFHDTVTCRHVGHSLDKQWLPDQGILEPIERFIADNPHWSILHDFQHDDGLMVLVRK